MLLVALQLRSHFRLLGSNTDLNVLKPNCPCKPCTAATMSTKVVSAHGEMTLLMTVRLRSRCISSCRCVCVEILAFNDLLTF